MPTIISAAECLMFSLHCPNCAGLLERDPVLTAISMQASYFTSHKAFFGAAADGRGAWPAVWLGKEEEMDTRPGVASIRQPQEVRRAYNKVGVGEGWGEGRVQTVRI